MVPNHCIVVSRHPLASQVGFSVLQEGGNAFDAAVAMGLCLAVVEPYMSGIGGGKLQYVFRTADGYSGAIDAPVICPSGAIPGSYDPDPKVPRGLFGFTGVKGRANEIGHISVAIPGVLAGLCFALDRYGTMELNSLIQPAINFANNGYPLSWIDVGYFSAAENLLKQFPATAEIFIPGGKIPSQTFQYPLENAQDFCQLDLARSLELIGEKGPAVFYKGDLAEAILEEMKSANCWITSEDLASYKPHELSNTIISYGGYTLFSGPDFEIFEALNILSKFNLATFGHNSPKSLHLIAEACVHAHADFYQYITSPEDKSKSISYYLGDNLANTRASAIQDEEASKIILFPDENEPNPGSALSTTTGYSCQDRWGNVVSALQTHGNLFGSGVTVPSTGILLNDQMLGFNPMPNTRTSIEPRKSRPIPGWPIIAENKEGSRFTVSAPGGNRVLCALVQVITNIIDFGMNLEKALEAPRIDCGSTPAKRRVIIADKDISPATLIALKDMGHEVETVSRSYLEPGGSPLTFALPLGIEYSVQTKKFIGGTYPKIPNSVIVGD